MYAKPEYKERSLLLSQKPTLVAKLDAVYNGLESRLNIDSSPLSLQNLLGLSSEDREYLHGKTVYEALTDSQVTIERLNTLKTYGKTLTTLGHLLPQIGIDGGELPIVGNLIYSLSIAQGFNKFKESISRRQGQDQLRDMFDELSEQPFVVPDLKTILESASSYIAGMAASSDSKLTEPGSDRQVH